MKRYVSALAVLTALTVSCDRPLPAVEDDWADEVGSAYITVIPKTKQVRNAAGGFTITVSANTPWQAEVDPASPWIKLAVGSAVPGSLVEGSKSGSIKVSYDRQEGSPMRSGKIVFTTDGVASEIEFTLTQSDKTFTNPLGGVPDPWIYKYGGSYYLCKAASGINISRSSKLSALVGTKEIWKAPVDNGSIKPWNTSHIWAPEMHYIDGRWYIYDPAGRPSSESGGSYRMQRSGVLQCSTSDPETGAWQDMGMLYTGDNYADGIAATAANTPYSIDMTVTKINGQLYAIWSGGPSNDAYQATYIARMSSPTTISSSRVQLSRAAESWEKVQSSEIQEGQAVIKHGGKVFIVYSCNGSWSEYYRLGYLMLADETLDPMVPSNWTKSHAPVFTRSDHTYSGSASGEPPYTGGKGVNGVGHCCFTTSPDGTEEWIVYHAKDYYDGGYTTGRSTHIQRFGWKPDGTPDFGVPPGYGEPLVVPSGEN
jgi:GH43 family beta-xylosidase